MEKIYRLRKGTGWTPARFWPEGYCLKRELKSCLNDGWILHPDQSNLEPYRKQMEVEAND